MLIAFFKLNQERLALGRIVEDLFYTNILDYYVWKAKDGWQARRRLIGTIARIYYISPNAGKLFYLRYLLLNVLNPTSFNDLRTVNSSLLSTFYSTYIARGLLYNDAKWDKYIEEYKYLVTGYRLQSIFVIILLQCPISDPLRIWNNYKER